MKTLARASDPADDSSIEESERHDLHGEHPEIDDARGVVRAGDKEERNVPTEPYKAMFQERGNHVAQWNPTEAAECMPSPDSSRPPMRFPGD